jgi:putative nucleotidyltransferase with HDIG domain
MEVNRLLQDVNTPLEKLVGLLEKDQSMVIKILRLVNSSFYGFKSKIYSLHRAVTLMGYSTVQHAVVTVAVIDSLTAEKSVGGFDVATFWRHSIGVAVMCRHLAAETRLVDANEAFTAGLIHDIGKIVLVSVFPGTFVALQEAATVDRVAFYAAEKKADTYPHNLIGSRLARRWLLPETLDLAVRHHHGSMAENVDATLPGLVAVADTLVNLMEDTPGHTLHTETIPEAIRRRLIPILKSSADWFPQIKEEINLACEFFQER